jgi:hypothetical protein
VALRLDLHQIRALIAAFDAGESPESPVEAFLCNPTAREAVRAQLERELPAATMTARQFAHFFLGHDVLREASMRDRAYVEGLYGVCAN